MKNVKSLFLLGTVMAVMSTSALADTVGTQTFKANIFANTCVIANLQQKVDLGDVQKAPYTKVEAWNVPSTSPVVKAHFDVTGCGNSITKVKVTPHYSSTSITRMIVNSGTAKEVYFDTGKLSNTDYDPKREWKSGSAKEFTLTNGAVQIPVDGTLTVGDYPDKVAVGTLDFQMTFTFDFV
ncbi:type 1 fimbrial protein [Salmonella enterica]|nr:type 1 fimbrial protein [Salmonella enterica]